MNLPNGRKFRPKPRQANPRARNDEVEDYEEDYADEEEELDQGPELDRDYVQHLRFARKLLVQGRSPVQVRAALRKRGLSEDEAHDIADDAKNHDVLHAAGISTDTENSSENSGTLVALGLLLILLGIGLSILSFSNAKSGGNQSFSVFTGLIVSGGFMVVRGLSS